MLVLLGISSLASLIAALVLGIRLLRLSSRTRRLPEFAMGMSFLIGGVFGFLFILIGNPAAGVGFSAASGEFLFRMGVSLLGVGICFTYVFVWQTFRPRSAVARKFTIAAIVCILASLWAVWTSSIEEALMSPIHNAGEMVRLGGMLWGCGEALHYYTAMRRRLALGLADPVVTNRFFLWGIAMGAGVMATLVGAFMTLSGIVDPDAWPYLFLGIFAAISPAAQWLAFFPPRAYRGWIMGHAQEAN